jgi:hypothetical protein
MTGTAQLISCRLDEDHPPASVSQESDEVLNDDRAWLPEAPAKICRL